MARRSDHLGEKPLHWVGSSKRDFLAFPAKVQSDMGYALGLAQLGSKHPRAKPWKGEGPGVFEVVESHDGDAFRGGCEALVDGEIAERVPEPAFVSPVVIGCLAGSRLGCLRRVGAIL